MSESTYLGRNISIAYRLSNRFYDRVLSPYQIGCGQQFFLLRIYENQGISMYDLARMGRFDKGTVTRAVQKLEEQGYIRVETDKADKRLRRLYTTKKAVLIIEQLYDIRQEWNEILVNGLTPDECTEAESLLDKMAQNAWRYMNERS